jgi:putative (di)nucleoside polyphosphate hydrolase
VGIALIDGRGRVFVGSRIDTAGAWQMPQGGIDGRERARDAARRELQEEVGTKKARIIAESRGWLTYELPKRLQPKVWGGKYRGQKQKWFLMLFTGSDRDIDLAAHSPEFSRWKWLPFEALPTVIVGFKRALYRKVVAEFADEVAKVAARHARPRRR